MEWLVKNGSLPTKVRVREYLLSQTKLSHGSSHKKIGKMIVKFCNYYLDTHEKVKYPGNLGLKKAEPAVAMPRRMVDTLTQHVVSRARSY